MSPYIHIVHIPMWRYKIDIFHPSALSPPPPFPRIVWRRAAPAVPPLRLESLVGHWAAADSGQAAPPSAVAAAGAAAAAAAAGAAAAPAAVEAAFTVASGGRVVGPDGGAPFGEEMQLTEVQHPPVCLFVYLLMPLETRNFESESTCEN